MKETDSYGEMVRTFLTEETACVKTQDGPCNGGEIYSIRIYIPIPGALGHVMSHGMKIIKFYIELK